MSIHAALTHRTLYRYDRLVSLGPQVIRLRPAPHTRTPILSYALAVAPEPHFLNWQQDPQGNFLARVVFPERVREFAVTVDLVADMATINPFDFFLDPEAETWPFSYDPLLVHELQPYRAVESPGPFLSALLAETPPGPTRSVDMLVALNHRLRDRIAYIVRPEPGIWSVEETLANACGSCRDSAWVLVQALRRLGFAARFVSGYLIQLVPDEKPLEGPPGPAADFTDLHAWAEVYLPGAGWIGLDATSGLLAGEGHIPLAASPDPISAAPITGMVEKSEVTFSHHMEVRRIRETPRVTKPYAEPVWRAITETGERLDRVMERSGIALTMGGEPTFVAATDRDAPEWNTTALGPTKRRYAGRLLRRLAPLWLPGAALQYTLGKHYPGEQLPRWALYAHGRADGEPAWHRAELLAADEDFDTVTPAEAARFTALLAERLQIDPAFLIAAHEDVHYYLWREKRLPANVLAEASKLADPLERARLARVFGQGLAAPVGSVLPLRRVAANGTRRWQSGKWFFRAGEMFLIPGDSPIGLRLPLDSLPWVSPENLEQETEPDPFIPRAPLPPAQFFHRVSHPANRALAGPPGLEAGLFRPVAQPAPEIGREEPDIVRTALAVEPRDGKLHVFFPPLFAAEDWLDLVAAVEDTAAELDSKVVLEGYLPPRDQRLVHFSVTPDPGVIEVNVPPARSFAEQIGRTEELYRVAREEGLAAEKFMLDGRHVGTGGGNHVVMGAAEPTASPFLRRPDLLKSLVGFWHNHPSLSYLFSGLFIGPTSQHPRLDEARQDQLHEIEIAFARVRGGADAPPWLVDRIFRNLLVDVTGNTHRTEFCIDKLYAPDGPGGRQGLVEFRAFEMPPHPELSSVQMLLIRAALAAFWERPYERPLIRWSTRLNDDFMLRHYVEADFRDALAELAASGFPLDPTWFAPHLEFRFPEIGAVTIHDVNLSLRHALEPWHVLGEEAAAAGTVRYVDSSVERVEARVAGFVPERFVLACNGIAVPLAPTETAGLSVGGVRFKAWAQPSALHPGVGVQTPLVFDLYDRWNGRSLGGLTYHVAHPGGRNYERFPVNANEAEARRRARFFPFGHTPGPMDEPRAAPSREHPRTLDLRAFA
ncbi:MAG TPA: transglutaminase family protein [Acetobacteraceae bacterium]|nr:transglutaminase family protein [Acetobacteraceae bacterium]